MPFIGIESQKIKSIRRILLSKHYSLLYQIEKDTVILIRFLDNKSAFVFLIVVRSLQIPVRLNVLHLVGVSVVLRTTIALAQKVIFLFVSIILVP